MRPQDFINQWNAPGFDESSRLNVYSALSLQTLPIPPESLEFLTLAGLPDSAAPFLSFGASHTHTLPSVADTWSQPPDFDRFRIIGSNSSGDPICIDLLTNAAVVYLNHDDAFDRIFMNTSVDRLAECLLAFRELVNQTNARNGAEAYLSGNVPKDILQRCIHRLTSTAPSAMAPGCSWRDEIQGLTMQ